MMTAYLPLLFSLVVAPLTIQPSTDDELIEGCLDLELMIAALEVVREGWQDWTRDSLAKSWPGGLEPWGCGSLPLEDCYNFTIDRRDGSYVPQCAELFLWGELEGEVSLGSVKLYYSTKTEPVATRVAERLVEAFAPAEDAHRFVLPAREEDHHESLQWERREEGRLLEVHSLDFLIHPQDGVWTVSVGYGVTIVEP